MTWYSTQGNHDLSQVNRQCACGRNRNGCTQIKKHYSKNNVHHGQKWYMPVFNYWVKPFGDSVDLEIISLDTNHHDSGRRALRKHTLLVHKHAHPHPHRCVSCRLRAGGLR